MIKPFDLRDSGLVARLQRVGLPLDIEEQLTHPRSPLRSVLIDSLLSPRTGPSTFVLDHQDEYGRQQGLAQMRSRAGRPERDVVFMSPVLDAGNGSHAVWQRLLTHLCVQTAERGGLRIYARLPGQSDELQLFKNVGFLEYGQEEIYRFNQPTNRVETKSELRLRPQQASDGWGLQKLYATLTPRAVQNAEGLAQGQWALTNQRWGEQGHRKGYVWEVEGEPLGALHIRAGKCGYLIRTLLDPDALEHAADLGRAALRLTTTKRRLPVYFAFRQYEAGWRHILPELGFEPFTSQTLVVKHMTVRVRGKSPALMSALEKSPPEGIATSVISRSKVTSLQGVEQEPKNDSPRRQSQKILSLLI